jgi:hypothetical protein
VETSTLTFFEELCAQPQPLLARTRGRLRFEVRDADEVTHWHVDIDRGDVSLTRDVDADAAGESNAVVHVDRALFESIVSGQSNAMSAVLRGEMGVEGSMDLLVIFQRMFPGPPPATTT